MLARKKGLASGERGLGKPCGQRACVCPHSFIFGVSSRSQIIWRLAGGVESAKTSTGKWCGEAFIFCFLFLFPRAHSRSGWSCQFIAGPHRETNSYWDSHSRLHIPCSSKLAKRASFRVWEEAGVPGKNPQRRPEALQKQDIDLPSMR